MNSRFGLFLCAAAVLAGGAARADDDQQIRVIAVVDQTEDGALVARPTRGQPAYYVPMLRGDFFDRKASDAKPEPPPVDVQRAIVTSLAEQGYRLASRSHAPSLILLFWWGLKSPNGADYLDDGDRTLADSHNSRRPSTRQTPTKDGGTPQALRDGLINGNSEEDGDMRELVFGYNYDVDSREAVPTIRTQRLLDATMVSRYYLIISALDYRAALENRKVVLWTARVSMGTSRMDLDRALQTLIRRGAPLCGADSDGARILEGPETAIGSVEVGTPVVR